MRYIQILTAAFLCILFAVDSADADLQSEPCNPTFTTKYGVLIVDSSGNIYAGGPISSLRQMCPADQHILERDPNSEEVIVFIPDLQDYDGPLTEDVMDYLDTYVDEYLASCGTNNGGSVECDEILTEIVNEIWSLCAEITAGQGQPEWLQCTADLEQYFWDSVDSANGQ